MRASQRTSGIVGRSEELMELVVGYVIVIFMMMMMMMMKMMLSTRENLRFHKWLVFLTPMEIMEVVMPICVTSSDTFTYFQPANIRSLQSMLQGHQAWLFDS